MCLLLCSTNPSLEDSMELDEEHEALFARNKGGRKPVLIDLCLEFHQEHWIYECHYCPMGGKTLIAYQDLSHVYKHAYLPWCQKRGVKHASYETFCLVSMFQPHKKTLSFYGMWGLRRFANTDEI